MLPYKKILHSLNLPFVVVEPVGAQFRVVDLNSRFLKLIHGQKENFTGVEARKAFNPPSLRTDGLWEQVQKSLLRAVQKGENELLADVPVEICPPNSREVQKNLWTIEISPITDHADGEISSLLLLIKEVKKVGLESPSGPQVLEEHLLEPLKRLEPLINKSSDLIWILDADRKFDYVSSGSFSVLGREPEEFFGKDAMDMVHPDDQETLEVSLDYLMKHKQLEVPPIRLLNINGHWRWMEAMATHLVVDDKVQGFLFNLRDVTHFLQQEREIRQLHERYALAVRATRDLIYDWDLVSDVRLRFYQNTRNLYGYSPEEVEKKFFWHNRIHPEDKERAMQLLDRHLEDPEASFVENSYRIRTRDGGYAHVVDHGFIIRNKEGKAVRIVGAMRDATQMIQQKQALQVANERYNMALNAANEMIWDWDLGTDEIIRNAAFPAVYGYNEGEADTARFWISRVHPDDRQQMEGSLMNAIEDPQTNQWLAGYQVKAADGTYKHVIDRAWISRDASGKATRIVGATMDVTESKKAYDQIQHQNTLLREIAWSQSHLVRAPLSRLLGLIEYIEQISGESSLKSEEWKNLKNAATELDDVVRTIVRKSENLKF